MRQIRVRLRYGYPRRILAPLLPRRGRKGGAGTAKPGRGMRTCTPQRAGRRAGATAPRRGSWTPLCGVRMMTSLKSLFISTIPRSVGSSLPSPSAPALVRGGIVGRRGAVVLASAPRAVRAGAGGAWTGARRGAGLCGGARSGSRGYPPLASGGSAAGGALCAQARSGVAAHS